MLKEALGLLIETGKADAKAAGDVVKEAKRIDVIERFSTPDRWVYVQDGKIEERFIPHPDRHHKVVRLVDMVAAARRWAAGMNDMDEPIQKGTIWIGTEKIICLCDDGRRRDTIEMGLPYEPIWKRIVVAGPLVNTQEQLQKLLRVELRSCDGSTQLLQATKQLKWKSGDTIDSTIEHGNVTMGRNVVAKAEGAGEIPTHLAFESSVYELPELEDQVTKIEVDVELDVQNKRIILTPMPDLVLLAQQSARQAIEAFLIKALEGSGVEIFCGTP